MNKKLWTVAIIAYLVGSFFGVGQLLGIAGGVGSKATAGSN